MCQRTRRKGILVSKGRMSNWVTSTEVNRITGWKITKKKNDESNTIQPCRALILMGKEWEVIPLPFITTIQSVKKTKYGYGDKIKYHRIMPEPIKSFINKGL